MPQGPLHGLKSATPEQGKPLFKDSQGWGIQADPAAQGMTDFRKAHPWISGAADFFTGGATDPSFESGPLDVLGAGIPFAHGLPGMYSRLGKAVSKLPEAMKSNSALNALRKLAHPEEIEFRGLGEMLTKRGARPVERAEIESHLAANPIDLKIKEFGGVRPTGPAVLDGAGGLVTPEIGNRTSWDTYQMPGATNYGETLIGMPSPNPVMEWEHSITMPDGTINYAVGDEAYGQKYAERFGGTLEGSRQIPAPLHLQDKSTNYQSAHYANDPNTLVYTRHNERNLPHPTGKWRPEDFFRDETITDRDIQDAMSMANDLNTGIHPPPGPKGRVIENVQSDWHQEGAKSGYAGRIVDPAERAAMERFEALVKEDADLHGEINELRALHEPTNEDGALYTMYDSPFHPDFNREANDRFRAASASLSDRRQAIEEEKASLLNQFPKMAFYGEVPNAPFKDKRWADLALKQQVLDVANRPDLEWLGIAPGSESVKRGESLSPVFHDETLPNKLGKILAPFGGKMEQASTPSGKWTEPSFRNFYNPDVGTHQIWDPYVATSGDEYLASVWPKTELAGTWDQASIEKGYPRPNLRANELQRLMEHERTLPIDIKIWLARMPPEMKADILKKGLPLLSLYAMMQSQQQPVEGLRAAPIQ